MIRVRPAAERGRTEWGWLDSRHTFSFGEYYDPEHEGFRALRVINDDRVRPGAWPKAWVVTETFGSVEGRAAAYLTPGGDKAPTLALRAGGRKVFGEDPPDPGYEDVFLSSERPMRTLA